MAEALPNKIESNAEAVHLLEVVQDHTDRKAFQAAQQGNENLFSQYKEAGRFAMRAQWILTGLAE